MGQVATPAASQALILTATDRLVSSNADGGMSVLASHIILLGEDAGQNLGAMTDIIGLGRNVLSAGITDTTLNGTIAIGGNAGAALTNGISGGVTDGSNVLIGVRAAQNMIFGGGCVIIGHEAFQLSPGAVGGIRNDRNVIIGVQAAQRISQTNQRSSQNVILGYRALRSVAGLNNAVSASVVIGDSACLNAAAGAGTQISSCVVIGQNTATDLAFNGTASQTVIIGSNVTGINRPQTSVYIGDSIALSGQAVSATDAVAVGSAITSAGVNSCTVIGANAQAGSSATGSVVIGTGAGAGGGVTDDHRLVVETVISGTRRAIFYGDLNSGNLIIGKSTPAVDRDMPGTNIVKLLNGTKTGTPVGGGFFYVSAGELHWMASSGSDYALTPSASLGNFTVATLPGAPSTGARAFATDALAPAFGATVAAGGAVFTPVFYNGAAWKVG